GFEGAGGRWLERIARQVLAHPDPHNIPFRVVERTDQNMVVPLPRRDIEEQYTNPVSPGALRLSHLVGSQVVDVDEQPVGRVGDLWLVAEPGDPTSLRLDALVVGAAAVGDRLGYSHVDGPAGPPPLRLPF